MTEIGWRDTTDVVWTDTAEVEWRLGVMLPPTKLLLHCDGVDGSQVFPDDSFSNHAMTAHGNAQVDTAQKKWGTGSFLSDGTGDYLSTPDHADWDIPANWTVDLWAKYSSTPSGDRTFICQYEDVSNYWQFHNDTVTEHTRFSIWSGGSRIVLCESAVEIEDTNWHHLAVCKIGNVYGLYKDGVQIGYTSDASMDTFAGSLIIGDWAPGGTSFPGWLEEIRITHANSFGAAPNIGLTDTIIVPSGPHAPTSSSSSSSLSLSSSASVSLSSSSSSSESSSSLSGSPSSSSSSLSLSSSSSSNSSLSSSSSSLSSSSSSSFSVSSSSISSSSRSLAVGVLPIYEPTGIVDVYLDAGTRRFATRDIYVDSVYYKGTLLDAPQIIQALSDLYYGVEQSTSVTLRFANGDDGVDDTWDDIVVTNADEPRNREVRVQRYDPSDGITFEFRGRISSYSLGPVVELVVEMRDEAILETLLPIGIVTTDEFTTTALSLGEPINLCFGHCRNVPLRNIQNNTTTDQYDYLIGYGMLESLWVDHANGLGVKRDGVLVNAAEYVFYDGSQGAPYNGYAFLRFTVEQMNFSGGFHNLTADVKGLELGGATAERNFATVIRNILSNTTWGLSESVDAASFIYAANDLDSIGDMYCDGSVTSQKQAGDIINDLLFPARGRIWRASDGEWEIRIDTAGTSVLNIGDNDGFYDNAEVVKAYATPMRDALQTAIVHYSLNPSDENPFKEMSVAVHTGFGLAKTYELPFVLEDDTAERVLSYLKNRSLHSDDRITVRVGMEGRQISRGNIVTVTAPGRNIAAKDYIVEQTTKGIADFLWECREYSAHIYDNEVIASPAAPVSSDKVVTGPTSLVSTTNVGDGSAMIGSLTMYVPPGQGDSYLAGGSFDLAAWKADHGFLIGIDDSDGDRAKAYIGNLKSYQDWNGVRLAQRLDREANTYMSYADEADQGATGNGKSAKAYIDSIGANDGTLVFTHDGTGATTTYTFLTNETIPANVTVIVEKGAILSIDSGKVLTINGSFEAGLYQVFSGAGVVAGVLFGSEAVSRIEVEWFLGAVVLTGITAAIKSAGSTLIPVHFLGKTYTVAAAGSTFSNPVVLEGEGMDVTEITGATRFTFEDNLEMRDMKISDFSSSTAIKLEPGIGDTIDWYRFKRVYFYDFPDAAIRTKDDQTLTISELRIEDCHFETIISYGIRAENIIKFANVSGNLFEDFGDTVSPHGGFCVFLSHNSLQANTEFINIHHNKFYDISGATDRECHAALAYGRNISINNNIVRGITADGEDAEAFYIKGAHCKICDNIVIDGQGDNSDGGIVLKGEAYSYDNIISGNILVNCGIHCNSGTVIADNTINGEYIYAYLTNNSGQDEYTITGNLINNGQIRVKGSMNSTISGNTVHNVDSYALFLGNDNDGDANENLLVTGNTLTVSGTATHSIHVDDATINSAIIDNFLDGGTTAGIREAANMDIIRGNIGYVTENGGAAANINDGGTINHGLQAAPTYVLITGSVASEMVSVTAIGGVNFTVAIKQLDGVGGTQAGTQQTIYWQAYYEP